MFVCVSGVLPCFLRIALCVVCIVGVKKNKNKRRGKIMMEVREWVRGHESVASMLHRVLPNSRCTTPLVAPLQQVALQARDVVEVAGPSGSAKSELLLQVKYNSNLFQSFVLFCLCFVCVFWFFWSSPIPHLTIVENCELFVVHLCIGDL